MMIGNRCPKTDPDRPWMGCNRPDGHDEACDYSLIFPGDANAEIDRLRTNGSDLCNLVGGAMLAFTAAGWPEPPVDLNAAVRQLAAQRDTAEGKALPEGLDPRWTRQDGRWMLDLGEAGLVRVFPGWGFRRGKRWALPYARCWKWAKGEKTAAIDVEGTTILDAIEKGEAWARGEGLL